MVSVQASHSTNLDFLLNSDLLPWDKLAKILPPTIVVKLRQFCDVIHWLLYFSIAISIPQVVVYSIFHAYILFYHSYYNTKCKQYYSFNHQKFTHIIITNNGTNSATSDCDNSPMLFFGHVFFFSITPMLIYLTWFYKNDHRYGILKFTNPSFTKRLRQLRWFYQVPIIIFMIPINLFVSYLYRICLPIVIMLPIVNWLFKSCTVFQRAMNCNDNMHINNIKDMF